MERVSTYIKTRLANLYEPGELRQIVQLIWCDILGKDALDIYLGKDTNLSTIEANKVEKIVERLLHHEPIQYIEGKTSFCGNDFTVGPGVLIPRPETSELIDLICAENPYENPNILDIGTGSGCIAITLSLHYNNATVKAWDISDEALTMAHKNAKSLKANVIFEKVDVLCFDEEGCTPSVDIIVSNPPYITPTEMADMEANVLEWEPHLALFVPQDDPLLFYRKIAQIGQKLLKKEGKLYFEINRAYGREMRAMLEEQGYSDIDIIKDISGNNRIAKAIKKDQND